MASQVFDQVAADALLKQIYSVEAMEDLSYSDRPFYALCPKTGGVGGNGAKLPILISTSQGYAPTVAAAQSVLAAQDILAFLVTPKVLLSVARISGLTLESSMTSKQAFSKGSAVVINSAIKRLSNAVSSALFRDGSGTVATITPTSFAVAGICQLADPADSVQFEVNGAIQFATAAGLLTGIVYVTSVNRITGVLTTSASLGGANASPSSWNNTYLNVLYANTQNMLPFGLQAWLTDDVTALGTAFNGVVRNTDSTRLGGVVYDGTAMSVKDAVVSSANLVAREGGRPDFFICSYESYTQLALDLGSNVIYTNLSSGGPGSTGKISFSGFKFMSPKGEITVVADRDCPPQKGFLLQMDTWQILHANEGSPVFLDENQGVILRTIESYDGREVRVKAYLNLACVAPGYNAKVLLSA